MVTHGKKYSATSPILDQPVGWGEREKKERKKREKKERALEKEVLPYL